MALSPQKNQNDLARVCIMYVICRGSKFLSDIISLEIHFGIESQNVKDCKNRYVFHTVKKLGSEFKIGLNELSFGHLNAVRFKTM